MAKVVTIILNLFTLIAAIIAFFTELLRDSHK
jgi:hypothetical protein